MAKPINAKRTRQTTAQNSNVNPRWLTLQSAATYTGLTGQTLRNWAKAGALTLHNCSPTGSRGRTLIDRRQLDTLIEGYASSPSTELKMNQREEGASRA